MKTTVDRFYLFYVLCSASTIISTVFGGLGTTESSGHGSLLHSDTSNPLLFALTVILFGGTLLISVPVLPRITNMLLQVRVLTSLYALAIVSIAWSATPLVTFRSTMYICFYLLAAAYLAVRFRPQELFDNLANSTVLIALGSVVAQMIAPANNEGVPGWTGLYGQKNWLGMGMAIGLLALVAVNRRWNYYRIFSFMLCFGVLIFSQSATAILCVVVGLANFLVFRLQKAERRIFLIVSGCLVSILYLLVPNLIDVVLGISGKDSTLTGRDVIWAFSLKSIAEHPFFGVGYQAFWNPESDSAYAVKQFLGWNPGYAHNGFIDITLGLGLAGLILLLFLLWDAGKRALRTTHADSKAGLWLLVVLEIMLLHNIAEVDFMLVSPLWFIFTLAYLSSWFSEREEMLERVLEPVLHELPLETPAVR